MLIGINYWNSFQTYRNRAESVFFLHFPHDCGTKYLERTSRQNL